MKLQDLYRQVTMQIAGRKAVSQRVRLDSRQRWFRLERTAAFTAFVIGNGLRAPGAALNWQRVNAEFGKRALLHLAIDRTNAVTDEGRILTSTDRGRNRTGVTP